jgi:hypothetical protein
MYLYASLSPAFSFFIMCFSSIGIIFYFFCSAIFG